MPSGQLNPLMTLVRRLVPRSPGTVCGDPQLLNRFARLGDETAFAHLVERHGPVVLGVCQRLLHDRHDAEDAFQATFLVLARKAGSIRKAESVGSWLYGVAYRTAVRARANRVRQRFEQPNVEAMSTADPVADAAWRELRPLLDQELERLPHKYRSPIVLCYLEGKTNQEAAEQLGWTKGTVSGRLARARDLLRVRLTRRGLVLSAALLTSLLTEEAASAVPCALARGTVQAAAVFAAGNVATVGLVSAPVACLAEGVMNSMFLTKLKILTATLVVIGVIGVSAGVVGQRALASKPASEAAAPKARAADPKPEDEVTRLKKENQQLRDELEKLKRENQILRLDMEVAKRQAEVERLRAQLEADAARRAQQRADVAAAQAQFQTELAGRRDALARAQLAAQANPALQSSERNLREIGIAFHTYHDQKKKFPAHAIYSKDGKPLLSWRVALLPYLGQKELYAQFKLDEPWDSEHNKKLLAKMPNVFAPVRAQDKEKTGTYYQVFVGKGTMFDGKEASQMANITDGTSNTIMAVEGATAVPWTKPEDLVYEADKPLPKLGGQFDGDFLVLVADGSLFLAKKAPDEKTMRLAITPNDGNVVRIQDLRR